MLFDISDLASDSIAKEYLVLVAVDAVVLRIHKEVVVVADEGYFEEDHQCSFDFVFAQYTTESEVSVHGRADESLELDLLAFVHRKEVAFDLLLS